ncbi:hypothetical protein ACHAXT_005055 [Thalassiosira profunda]
MAGKVASYITLGVLAASIVAVRLVPHPERSAHGFGDLFQESTDPDAAVMRILPGADEEHFTVVERQGLNCEPDNWENACTPPYHYHTYQTETFEVKEGAILVKLEGEILKIQAGDGPVTVPIGKAHTYIKTGADDVEVDITLRPNPGGNGQRFFPNLFGSIRDGGPNLVQILYVFCTNGVRLADIPGPIHEGMCLATRAVAPLLGYRHEYPEYGWKE